VFRLSRCWPPSSVANGRATTTPAAYVPPGMQPAVSIGAVVVAFGAVAALFIPARARGRGRSSAHRDDDEVVVRRRDGGRAGLGVPARSAGSATRRSRTLPSCRPSSATPTTADGTDLLIRQLGRGDDVEGGRRVGWIALGVGSCWSMASANTPGRYEHVGDQMSAAGLEVPGVRPTEGRAARADVAATSSTGASSMTTSAERLAVVRGGGGGGRPVRASMGTRSAGLIVAGYLLNRPTCPGPRRPDVRPASTPSWRPGRRPWRRSLARHRSDPIAIPTGIKGRGPCRATPSVAGEDRGRPALRRGRHDAVRARQAGSEQKARPGARPEGGFRIPTLVLHRRRRSPRPGLSAVGCLRGRSARGATQPIRDCVTSSTTSPKVRRSSMRSSPGFGNEVVRSAHNRIPPPGERLGG